MEGRVTPPGLGAGLLGVNVVVTPTLPIRKLEQFRFPRSKRKRIRKKWARKTENFRVKTTEAFLTDGALFVSLASYRRLKDAIESGLTAEAFVNGDLLAQLARGGR